MQGDLTMVDTRHLPPEYAHVRFSIRERQRYEAMVRAGQITPVGSLQQRGGTLYTTIRRTPEPAHRAPARPWVRPVTVVGVVTLLALGFVWAVTALVAYLVREFTDAVSQAGPALGFLVALSLVLLGVAATRRGRMVEGTFRGIIR